MTNRQIVFTVIAIIAACIMVAGAAHHPELGWPETAIVIGMAIGAWSLCEVVKEGDKNGEA